jgi:hypothetical protein
MNLEQEKEEFFCAFKNKKTPDYLADMIKRNERFFTSTSQEPEFIKRQQENSKKMKKKNTKKLSKCSSSFNVENNSKETKIWMIFREGRNEGPFVIQDIFNIIKTSYDPSLILIKNIKLNKLFTTDFFLDNYKKENSSQSSLLKEPLFSKNSDKYEIQPKSLKEDFVQKPGKGSNSFGTDDYKGEYYNPVLNQDNSQSNQSTPLNRNNSNPYFPNQIQNNSNKFTQSFKDYGTPFSKGDGSIESDDSDEFNPFKIIDLIKHQEKIEDELSRKSKSDNLYNNLLEKEEKNFNIETIPYYYEKVNIFNNQPKSLPHLVNTNNNRYNNQNNKYNVVENNFFAHDYGDDYDSINLKKESLPYNLILKKNSFHSDNINYESNNNQKNFRNKQKSLNKLNEEVYDNFDTLKNNPYKNNRSAKQINPENFNYNYPNAFKSEKVYKKNKKSQNESDYHKKDILPYQNESTFKVSSKNTITKKNYKMKTVYSKNDKTYIRKTEN